MKISPHIFWLILLAFIATLAQTPDIQTGKTFSSFEGGYIVTLPADARTQSGGPVSDLETAGLGKGYFNLWKAGDIFMESAFVEIEKDKQGPANKSGELLETFTGTLLNRMQAGGWKLAREQAVDTNGSAGREFEFEGPYNRIICRVYLRDWRIVRLRASFSAEREKAAKFLNSLKLASRDEIAALKIKDATPAEFPQPPIPDKISDVEAHPLKGRVEKMLTEKEILEKNGQVSKRQKSAEFFYDPRGSVVKIISYDYTGHPDEISVYGSIDGMNVSRFGYAANERIFTGAMPSMPGVAPKKRDTRYHQRSETKYDEKKRIAERIVYDNAGDVFSRAVFTYGEGQRVTLFYDGKGGLEKRVTEILDKNRNVTRMISARTGKDPVEYIYDYKYVTFDKKGNWTKRIVSSEVKRDREASYRTDYTEYRTISFYR